MLIFFNEHDSIIMTLDSLSSFIIIILFLVKLFPFHCRKVFQGRLGLCISYLGTNETLAS